MLHLWNARSDKEGSLNFDTSMYTCTFVARSFRLQKPSQPHRRPKRETKE